MRAARFWLAVAAALVLGACGGDDGPEKPEPIQQVNTAQDGGWHNTRLGKIKRVEVDGKPCLVLRSQNTYGDTFSITCDWSPR